MDNKKLIWLGLFLGSLVGGYIPMLWGDDLFSFSSIIFTAIGGFLGIWLMYKFIQ